ncbi:MAG: hypothetical protein O3C43_17845 [Verrucomicrobia bacterium]|nr:hypothetical protein [Verrucomicrobiota bacterium]MDA1068355.1 hypothetical protein [Verrucomicrobiota bacterium]
MKYINALILVLVVSISFWSCSSPRSNPQDLLESSHVKEAASKANAVLSKSMVCWKGVTPDFDGRVDAEEYRDASHLVWDETWIEAMPQEIESPEDLDFDIWVKHDGEYLYLAFDIRDNLFYGIETERWLPAQDPNAHRIGERERGRPWFGDMIEILLYTRLMDLQLPVFDVTGDGRGIQIIYNLTKSLEGGVGVPGMLPHGPNTTIENFENNKRWILEDIIETQTVRHDEENRYTVEVRIRLNGGIEIGDGVYWSDNNPDTPIGFNLSIGDVDGVEKSPDGLLHHETWWAGKWSEGINEPKRKFWGLLIMTSKEKKDFELIK